MIRAHFARIETSNVSEIFTQVEFQDGHLPLRGDLIDLAGVLHEIIDCYWRVSRLRQALVGGDVLIGHWEVVMFVRERPDQTIHGMRRQP